MSENYKHVEGSVSVNENITPITRQPIGEIDSTQWNTMTLPELIEQHNIINERLIRAQTMGLGHMVEQIQRGLCVLNDLIQKKQENHETYLL